MSYSNQFEYDSAEPDECASPGDIHDVFCKFVAGYVWITIAVTDNDYDILAIKHSSLGVVTDEFKDSHVVIRAIESYLDEITDTQA